MWTLGTIPGDAGSVCPGVGSGTRLRWWSPSPKVVILEGRPQDFFVLLLILCGWPAAVIGNEEGHTPNRG